MQAQMTYNDVVTHSRPAMDMWEWFDMWSLCQEARQISESLLLEDSDAMSDADKRVRAGGGTEDEQHDYYSRHTAEARTNHLAMSDEESKARHAHVGEWRKLRGGKGKYKAKTASGHDLKSAHSGFEMLQAVSNSDHRGKLASAASKVIDPVDRPQGPRGGGSAEQGKEGSRLSPTEAHLGGTMLTNHGERTDPYVDKQRRQVYKALAKRRDHIARGGKDTKPDDAHGYNTIANATGVSAHHVESMAKGTEHNPMRSVSHQAHKHIKGEKNEDGTWKRAPGKLTHEWMAKAMASTLIKRKKDKDRAGSPAAKEKAAVAAGGALSAADKEGKEGAGLAGLSQRAGEMLKKAKPTRREFPKWHHPDTKEGKTNPSLSKERHEALVAKLNSHEPDEEKHLSPTSTIDVTDAAKKLHRAGHSSHEIAKHLDHPEDRVNRMVADMPAPTAAGAKGGGGPRPEGEPLRKAAAKERERRALAIAGVPEDASEHEKRKGRARLTSGAVRKDLHHLYPTRREGEDEASFRKRIDTMPAHEKDVHSKVVGAGAGPEKLGVNRDASRAHAGFSGIPRIGRGSGLDHPGEFDEKAAHEKHGVAPAFDDDAERAKHGAKGPPKQGKKTSDADHAAKVEAWQKKVDDEVSKAREAHKARRVKALTNVEADRNKHKENVDKYYDQLHHSHSGVHAAMNKVLDDHDNDDHPVTKAFYQGHEDADVDESHGRTTKAEKARGRLGKNLLDHHFKAAKKDREMQQHLGTKPRVKEALTNIAGRVERHGKYTQAVRNALGIGEERPSGHKTQGGKIVQDPERREFPKSPVSGGPKAPTGSLQEPPSDPKRRERHLRPAGRGHLWSPLSNLAKRVIGKGEQAKGAIDLARGKVTPPKPPEEPGQRGPEVPQATKQAAKKARVTQVQMMRGAKAETRRKKKAERAGLGDVAADEPVSKSVERVSVYHGKAPRVPTAKEYKKGIRQRKVTKDEFETAGKPRSPQEIALARSAQQVKPSEFTGSTRAGTPSGPVQQKPKTKPDPTGAGKTRIRPTGTGRGHITFQSGEKSRGATGVTVDPRKKEEPWEKKVGSFFKRAMSSGTPQEKTAEMRKRYKPGAPRPPKAPKPRPPISAGAKKFASIFKKPEQGSQGAEAGRPGEQRGTFTRSESGAVRKEEDLFVRSPLSLYETSSLLGRTTLHAR